MPQIRTSTALGTRTKRLATKYVVRSAEQLAAMASSSRLDVLYALIALGEGTVGDIAEYMVSRPSSLYRHVAILLDAGLVMKSGTINTGREEAFVYVPVAQEVRLPSTVEHPELVEGVRAVLRAQCKCCEREMLRAADSPSARPQGPQRNFRLVNGTRWVSRKQLKEINFHLDAVVQILMDAGEHTKNKEPIGITLATRPLGAGTRDESLLK